MRSRLFTRQMSLTGAAVKLTRPVELPKAVFWKSRSIRFEPRFVKGSDRYMRPRCKPQHKSSRDGIN